ncbi:MAG TPA: UxaA family hydrolase [Opitutaceae bacterium]|nr:UxaA family hydrolase [Opitutaceae bacterium]
MRAQAAFKIHPADNVATLIDDGQPGPVRIIGASDGATSPAHAREPISRGHKIALVEIPAGAPIIKFGVRIGHAIEPISPGAWVHLHNLASDLDARSQTLDVHTGAPTDTNSSYV